MDHVELAHRIHTDEEVHHNCAQAVLMAYADEMGLTREQACQLGANFGSGMRCGSTCGAVTGALMVMGMVGYDSKAAGALLRTVKERHQTLDCPVLLKMAQERGIPRKEHCDGMVMELAGLLEEMKG